MKYITIILILFYSASGYSQIKEKPIIIVDKAAMMQRVQQNPQASVVTIGNVKINCLVRSIETADTVIPDNIYEPVQITKTATYYQIFSDAAMDELSNGDADIEAALNEQMGWVRLGDAINPEPIETIPMTPVEMVK